MAYCSGADDVDTLDCPTTHQRRPLGSSSEPPEVVVVAIVGSLSRSHCCWSHMDHPSHVCCYCDDDDDHPIQIQRQRRYDDVPMAPMRHVCQSAAGSHRAGQSVPAWGCATVDAADAAVDDESVDVAVISRWVQ